MTSMSLKDKQRQWEKMRAAGRFMSASAERLCKSWPFHRVTNKLHRASLVFVCIAQRRTDTGDEEGINDMMMLWSSMT